MWIFSEDGMLTAVGHRDHQDVLWVRARRREHLEAFLTLGGLNLSDKIQKMPNQDYEYRVEMPKKAFSETIAKQVEAITYSNFKGRCDTLPDQDYAQGLHKSWEVMNTALAKN